MQLFSKVRVIKPGSNMFRGSLDQAVGPLLYFIIKANRVSLTERTKTGLKDYPNHPKQRQLQGGPFSMVKYTVWSYGP